MKNLWEKAVVLALEPFIAHDSIIIDCGANIGGVSQSLADGLGTDGLIISIEPNNKLKPQIQEHLSQSECKFFVISKAAWNESGNWLPLYVDQSHYSTGSSLLRSTVSDEKILVETIALDDIPEAHSDKLAVIKIDVEGAETSVLFGATKIISAYKPVICLEISSENLDALDFLTSLDYQFFLANSYEQYNSAKFHLEVGVWNIVAVPSSLELKVVHKSIGVNALERTFELNPGRYVFQISLDDTLNCYNSIGLIESSTGKWAINYEIEMKHLKHFTNSTLPISTSSKETYTVRQGMECGHDHVKSIELSEVSISIQGKPIVTQKSSLRFTGKIKTKLLKRAQNFLRKKISQNE